jgi:hypothetical protein
MAVKGNMAGICLLQGVIIPPVVKFINPTTIFNEEVKTQSRVWQGCQLRISLV